VVGDETEVPEIEVEVRVVAVAEERLRVGGEDVGIQVAEYLELVLAADGRDHGANLGIRKGAVEVARTLGG
jgi:hypothetical protein